MRRDQLGSAQESLTIKIGRYWIMSAAFFDAVVRTYAKCVIVVYSIICLCHYFTHFRRSRVNANAEQAKTKNRYNK